MRHDFLRYLPILCILLISCSPQQIASSLLSSSKELNAYDSKDVVPFSFPLPSYTASIPPDIGPNYYILTNEPRFGVPEPFNGQPSGTVSFVILGNLEYREAFSVEALKCGGFYFLRLRTTHNAEFNAKKQSVYSFQIQAVFQSEQVSNRPPITLSNKTQIIIQLTDRNDNCPFFTQDIFRLVAFENATLFTKIGTVHAADADRGINGQIYYFLQPERVMVPFRIDTRSGDIFPTKSLAIKRGVSTSIEQITYFSKFEGLEDYSFKVIARHRGNLSHVSCEFVSHAQVYVKVKPIRSDAPQISSSLYTDIEKPGSPGTVYGTISVASFCDPQRIHLSIIEPEAAALFELVRMDQQPKWQLQLKFQYPTLSLISKVGLTLEATDTEIATVGNIPSTSRHFLEVTLLPQPAFQIRLPQAIHISVSEVALVNSTVFIINPNLSFYIYNSSFLFTEAKKSDDVPFGITETGAVVVTKPIDLETLGTDRLEIAFTVVDRNNILLSSMADSKLVITILDYNEHGPEILNDGAERSIPENIPVGSEVLQIEARDPDFSATRLTFTLFDEEKLPFNFSTTKPGSMLLKTPLDAETMPTEFHVKVKVSDSGLPFPRSVIVIYIIRIIDVNEFSPVFVEKSCEAQLAVSPHGQVQTLAPTGLELGRFFAEDLDRDGSSHVKIKLASTTISRPCFKLDSDTGRLLLICSNIGLPETTVTVHLETTDGELYSEQPFELKINLEKAGYGRVYSKSCQPSGIYEKIREQKQKRTDYEYRLADITSMDTFFKKNDEIITPTLSVPTVLRIPENLPIGTPILTFSTKFLESFRGDQIPQLVYGVVGLKTFIASNDSVFPPYQAFRLRGESTSDVSVDDEMVLEIAAPIDRETYSAFLISLRVCVLQDSARPCASSSVSIFIEDLLDAPPRFIIDDSQAGTHTFYVSEDEAEGSIIGQVDAVDDDIESKLRFSLGNYKEQFKIHHRTGRISLKQRLDRELLDSYLISVKVVDIFDAPTLKSPPELNALALKSTPHWGLERTATTYVRVHVLDANDNNPEFIGMYNDIVVPSDLPKGAYVTTLRARDADDSHNALLQYSLFGSDADKACFDCDLATGVVRIAAECEGLQPGYTHSLTAWVRDLGSPEPRQTSTEFKVTVLGLRVNAYPPRFNNPTGLYQGRLKEGAPIGSRVLESESENPLLIRVNDPEGLPLVFRTVGGSGLGTFTVTSEGFITSTREVDAERTPFSGGYWLEVYAEEDISSSGTVTATDGIPPRFAVAEVFIQIEDVNDNRPMPEAPEYRFHVTENTPVHTIVATVTGRDRDVTGNRIHHAIVSGDPDGYFVINPSTGQIATSGRLIDRETSFMNAQGLPTDKVHLVIHLTDSNEPSKTTVVHATAVIDDMNDNTPRFLFTRTDCGDQMEDREECYHFVHRPTPQGSNSSCLGRVFAVDLDRGANGSVVYEMAQPDSFFSVDPVSGQVCPTGTSLTLPSENVIWVTARDHGFPPRFTAQPIAVHISVRDRISESDLPADRQIRLISAPPSRLTISPQTPPGTVLYNIEVAPRASSPNAIWAFHFADNLESTPFGIAALSRKKAVIYLQQWPNPDSESLHELGVVVSLGNLTTTHKTSIVIEASERQPPVIDTSAIVAGKRVEMNVTDFRQETEESGASGVIVNLGVSESALVGSLVCSLGKTAASASPFIFSIVSAENNSSLLHFHLSKDTGELTVTEPLDFETQEEHQLLVGLFHHDELNSRGSYFSLVIKVIDVNDFAPFFQPLSPIITSADTPVGYTVGRISAYDLDFNGEAESGVTYAISPVEDAEFFNIDKETGALQIAKPLWNSQTNASSLTQWPPRYCLNVRATDRGGRFNHTLVTITLSPGPGAVSRPLPRFRQSTFLTKITENAPAGYIIAALKDFLETRPLVPIVFKLLNHNDKFSVSANSGFLVALTSLDREVEDIYRLKVEVSGLDGLASKLPHTAVVEVHVLDVNDNNPQIESFWMYGILKTKAPPNSPVIDEDTGKPLTLYTVDPDSGSAGEVTYTFVGPLAEHFSEMFSIDQSTGVLYQLSNAPLPLQKEIFLNVEISDQGSPVIRTADALVRIRVRFDEFVNEASPHFSPSIPLVVSVFLPTYEGAEIARFTAIDPDFNDTVTYHISEGDPSDFFTIDQSTGILCVSPQLAGLSTISQRQLHLQIEAKDSDAKHTAIHNVSVFIHIPDASKRSLVIEPSGGLNVSLIEHFTKKGDPQFLGQFHVRNALPNEVFSFELANTSTRSFSIDRYTGALYATGDPIASSKDLDREITPVVRLRVLVRDRVSTSLGMSQQRFGEGWVSVHLEDNNDHDPEFIGLPYHTTFCVKEHPLSSEQSKLNGLTTPANHVHLELQKACQSNFFKVEAKDPDSGRNGEVTYQIMSTQPHAEPPLVSIDPLSGRLSLIRAVPSDWAGRRLIARIRATDGGQRYADTEVWVQLVARVGPHFTSTHYAAVVPEDASIGESVASVVAISASGTTLLYRIVSIGPDHAESSVRESPFYLDYETGIIRVGSPLDYEKTNYYNLIVEALDTTTGNTARANVYINVTDVNDERPVFAAPLYRAVISEDTEIGSVISLHPPQLAYDADSGTNGQIRYYLQTLNDEETIIGQNTLVPSLEIDEVTGTIQLAEKVDYEKQPSLIFWIIAVDLGSPPLIGRSLVELTILDANDNPPRFDPETGEEQNFENTCHREATVSVDAPTDSFVLRLTASDPDVNDTLTYRLLPASADAELFRINSTTGVVLWRPPLSPESYASVASALLAYESGGTARLSFEVAASDGLHTVTCWVEVSVVPNNRHSPHFPVRIQSIQIAEDARVGSRIALLTTAEDGDVGAFSYLSYSLLETSKEIPFSLDSQTGELTLSSPLDRESKALYSLTVIASDAGGLSDFMNLNITVTDVNDNSPIIEQTGYEITLPPSEYTDETWVTFTSPSRIQPGGLRLPLRIQAHDKDSGSNANIIYRLLPASQHISNSDVLPFTIDAESGEVLLTHPLQPSTQEYGFFVEACDQPTEGRSLCSEPVEVSIHLAPEDLPSNINITCSAIPIPEIGHPLNEPVAGCQIKSVPDLKHAGVWSLVGSASVNIFKIDAKSGSIFANKDLDYESQTSHDLIVQYRIPSVSENGPTVPFVVVTRVAIKVEDVNDCTPIFLSDLEAKVSIPENVAPGRRIYHLQATDCDAPDKGLLLYSIRKKSSITPDLSMLPFSIDSDGWITVTGPIDREAIESFELVTSVTDTARHTSVAYLTVEVLDLNDNAPEWSSTEIFTTNSPSAEVYVTENSLPSSPIFKFSAVDKDTSSDPALMKYYQVGETLQEFVISPDGSVYVRRRLDAESKQNYELKVNAFDGLHESTRPFTLKIQVVDVNDNPPICHIPDRETEVLESAENGTILFHLNATDADILKDHSEISYGLADVKNDAKAFAVDQKTGEVSLVWELDYELRKEYSFRVKAKDSANHACHYSLKVRVLDVNDNAPVFDEPIKISSVPENAPVGSLVGKVHATDADSVDANGLEYSIYYPRNASFSVERHSGLLRVVQPLDRETLALHQFVVLVTDSVAKGGGLSGPVHSATASVEIQLVDVNDSPPQFVEPRPIASISEASPVGTLIMKLTAISLDEGENAVVRYRLLETDKPEFALNSTTGELYLIGSLDYERTPRYFLTIEAKDSGSPPLSTTTVATINVVDENDNSPYFIGQDLPLIDNSSKSDASETSDTGVFSFEVFENSPVGTQIGRITARDPDLAENGRLSFSLCEPMQPPDEVITTEFSSRSSSTPLVGRLFEIGESRGEINLLFSPDREVATLYEFKGCVVDHGEPPRSAVTRIRVTIRDTNDCQPQFERSNYEFYIQVDRNGNVVSTDQFGSFDNAPENTEILLGHLALRDMDASPNAGPFKCKLTGFVGSSVGSWDTSTPLFSVKTFSATLDDSSNDSAAIPTPTDITFFENLEANQTGFCSLYAAPTLPLGSKNLVVRVHDSGMTALHSSVTITVHVSRQSNLPPEIVSSNVTLVIFRDASGSTSQSLKHLFDLDNSLTITKAPKTQNLPLMRVTVRDRTAYDQLFFELLPDSSAAHFTIDQYDGSIYVKPSSPLRPVESGVSAMGEKDPSLEWLEPALPRLPAMAQLNSGEYRLRVRVTNGSLSSNNTVHLKVITVTEEMLEAACVLHVADISPNELFILHLDEMIRRELAEGLFKQSTPKGGAQAKGDIFLISVQSASSVMRRQKRSVGGGVDILISVHDPKEKRFIESGHLVQRIHALQANLSKSVGHQLHAYNSLCTQKKCESGSCVTRIELSSQMETVEVHGASQISPRFTLVAKCRCSTNFGGADCERPRDICATTTCTAPRICVPSQTSPLSQHACVCPLPWTGPNCDRLFRPSISSQESFPGSDACFSDACFLQKEKGPLQFTGGSFAHWQIGNPNEYKIEIAFSIRTRQQSGPLFAVNWNALRAFRIRLVNNGKLAVSPVEFTTGKPSNDWIISGLTQLGDGQWHRVRFVLFASATDSNDRQWWIELTVDGAQTYSKLIAWSPGDTERQDVFLGAELVHGFRPLAEFFYPENWVVKDQGRPVDVDWPHFNLSAPPAILRSGFVGCIKDVLIDRVKPPYQLGLNTQQAVLSAMQNRKATVGASRDDDRGIGGLTVLQLVRTHKLEYQCSSQKTFESSCAYAPCLNGGTCTSRRALAFAQIDKGPAAVRPSDFNCTCQTGFQGSLCEEATDICRLQPCLNGGSCEPVRGKSSAYQCICPQGFKGVHCEAATNNTNIACARAEAVLAAVSGRKSVPLCNHGAACLNTPGGPTCACPLGWRGGRCEHDVNECSLASTAYAGASAAATESDGGHYGYPDLSGSANDPLCNTYGSRRGVCINLPGSYQCNCSLGYTGRNCQIRNLTPLKPDSSALGLTPMHGYIIAGIFALVFLLAVITVVILTCCFRRRSSLTNHFYTTRNGGQSNSSFFPGCDKMLVAGLLQPQQQQQVKLLSDSGPRLLPDGGDGSATYSPTRTLGGSMILGPGRPLLTPDVRRQSSCFMDENGRLVLLRPNSVVGGNGGPNEPLQMVYLGGSGASGTISPVPVGYVPATTALARRSFIDCGMQHRIAPMTPQHLSQVHLVPHGNHMAHLQHPASSSVHQQPRPGSSNTMTSDRISLGSGSDQFSVQSGGPRGGQGQTVMMPPQSQYQQIHTSAQQQVFYVYPQSTASTRRSQIIQPHQMLSSEALSPVFYRSEGNHSSVGNLSASGRLPLRDQRLSLIGAPKAGRIINHQPQLIPLQVIPNGAAIRPAPSLNLVRSVRPRAISPPTVQSHPYWAESTLSLLPPIPPSALANQPTPTHQNPRTSLYRKAASSNADLRRPNRLARQRNSLVLDGEPLIKDHRTTQRPQSVCTPLLLANGSGEACSNPVEDLGNNMHWEHQAGATPSSAFVIAEPRGLQKIPLMRQTPVLSSSSRQESVSGSANTLSAPPPAADLQTHKSPPDGTLKASPRLKGDEEEPSSNGVKTNGFTPRPMPPNVIINNGNDTSKSDHRKVNIDGKNLCKPLLDNSGDSPVETLKKQN